VHAGAGALGDAASGQDLGAAYRSRMAVERSQDQYDAQHYRTARTVGQLAGTGLGLLALGPLDAAGAAGVRIAEATPIVGREIAALGGLGATGGVASQGVSDLQRGRLGTMGDYAGSALGGATVALTSLGVGPGKAGALGGAMTSTAQDALNGRKVNWGDASQAALAGGYVAGPLGLAGRNASNGLSIADKGRLGEALGRARTRLNGQTPQPAGRVLVNGGPKATLPDHMTSRGVMTEQKFGPKARLSPNQRAAAKELGPLYRVDHFLPRDVGAIVAFPYGLLGPQALLGDSQVW
jgi:hypothetical protein